MPVSEPSPAGPAGPPALTEGERAMLEFEASWRRHVGAKEAAIRDEFALTPARYYQLLERLIDTRPAMEYDALLVARLRRMRPDGGSPRAVSAS